MPAALRRQWIDDGYAVLPGLCSPEEIRAHLDIVGKVRATLVESKDASGFGERIGQLHQRNPQLAALALKPSVTAFLRWAFGDEPVLFGSLNFEKGTQQELHIDAIFFYTEPVWAMAGLWVALEDVHPDAGPLFYVPGSHRWPFVRGENLLAGDPALAARARAARDDESRTALASEMGQLWTKRTLEIERERDAVRKPAFLKAGDGVIWHGLLAHGGLARNNPRLSRNSVVYHFIGEHARLFTFQEFFLESGAELRAGRGQPKQLERWGAHQVMRYRYFVSYKDGREIQHPF